MLKKKKVPIAHLFLIQHSDVKKAIHRSVLLCGAHENKYTSIEGNDFEYQRGHSTMHSENGNPHVKYIGEEGKKVECELGWVHDIISEDTIGTQYATTKIFTQMSSMQKCVTPRSKSVRDTASIWRLRLQDNLIRDIS